MVVSIILTALGVLFGASALVTLGQLVLNLLGIDEVCLIASGTSCFLGLSDVPIVIALSFLVIGYYAYAFFIFKF